MIILIATPKLMWSLRKVELIFHTQIGFEVSIPQIYPSLLNVKLDLDLDLNVPIGKELLVTLTHNIASDQASRPDTLVTLNVPLNTRDMIQPCSD